MKKRILWLCLPLAFGQATYSFAQDGTDVLRYSQLQFGGSARTLGIGGANVALGADYGSVSSNPAGLGLYQKSEIQLSPGVGIGQGEGQLLNGITSAGPLSQSANSFNLSGGAVFSGRPNRRNTDSNWKGGAFAIGFTRIADFNTGSNYSGTVNDRNSLFQRLREYRTPLVGYNNGSLVDQDQYGYTNLDGLAFGTYLTDTLKNRQGQYGLVTQRRANPITQGERVINSGSMSQFDLAYGGSYRDKLYIGLGLGVVTSNFRSARTFSESDADATTPLNNYVLYDDLHTTGTGLNLRLGLIYRATDAVRLGASVQTPTWMRMTDTYSSTITSNFDATPGFAAEQYTASTNTTQYAYTITTPFRANGGVAVTIGKYGFVTGDIEYLGYQQGRLDSNPSNTLGDNYDFAAENATIKQQYTNAVNLRFGGEARLDIFRVRLGYARYGSPYNSNYASATATGLAQNYYTAGLGLRQGNFFVDVAGVYTKFNTYYSPYLLNDYSEPVVKVDNTRFTTTLTAGFTF
ncbi:MAG: hypothetical protein EOO57_13965 [Hymenobacter sp.]|nr:MAG: hypothetical protein EOO57_13965 [Hymenobacter sp.]